MPKFRYLYLLIFMFHAFGSLGQNATLLDINNGLTTSNLTDLTFDSKGNLWIGSYNGLMKNEGGIIRKFTGVGKGNKALSNTEMHSVIEDKCGNIWVATTGGVDVIDPISYDIQHIYPKSPIDGSSYVGYIYWIHQDNEEFIWISTDIGIFIIDNNTFSCTPVPFDKDKLGIPNQIVSYNGAVNTNEGMWFHTMDGLVFREYYSGYFHHRYHNPKKWTVFDSPKTISTYQSDLTIDKDGQLWYFQSNHCLTVFNPKTNIIDTFNVPFPKDTWLCCKSIALDENQNIWIGSRHGGLMIYFRNTGTYKNYMYKDINSIIPSNYIYSILRGKDNLMYVATSHGLSIIDYYDKIFTKRYLSDQADFINLKYESGDITFDSITNSVLIPFYHYGFLNFNIQSDSSSHKKFSDGKVAYVIPYQNYYLIGTKRSLYKYTPDNNLLEHTDWLPALADSLPGYVVWYQKTKSGFVAKKSSGWILHAFGEQLKKYKSYGFKRNADYNEKSGFIWNLTPDLQLQQIHSESGQSKIFDIQKHFIRTQFPFSVPRKLIEDNGDVWITSNNGIVKYNTIQDTMFIYTPNEGLSNSFVFNVLKDPNGNIWVATLGGIDWFDKKRNKFRKVLPIKNTSYMDAFGHAMSTPDGKLLFHYGNKLFIIDSRAYLNSIPINKDLVLSSIQVNNEYLNFDSAQGVKLPSDQNNLTIRFTLRDFINAELCTYYYKINNSDWINLGNNTELNFSQLSPDDYQIKIKAIDNYGREAKNQLVLPISIIPPFYVRPWFIALSFFGALAFMLIYFKRRIQTVKEQKNILIEMAELRATALKSQINPHFIFNSLNAIQEAIINNHTDKAYDYLSKFSKFLRRVLNQSDILFLTITEELEMIKLYLDIESQRFFNKINLQLIVEEDLEMEMIPAMILQPFIENSIWHGLRAKAKDKDIIINIYSDLDVIKVEIMDNGIGIYNSKADKEAKHQAKDHISKGINITEARLRNLFPQNYKGQILIFENICEDAEYPGTKVSFSYPRINKNKLWKQ